MSGALCQMVPFFFFFLLLLFLLNVVRCSSRFPITVNNSIRSESSWAQNENTRSDELIILLCLHTSDI